MSSSSSLRLILLRQQQKQSYRHFTTTSSLPNEKNKKISIALYRQLLRWCNSHLDDSEEEEIPLGKIPPLTLQPPYLNTTALSQLPSFFPERIGLPSNSIVESNKLIIPIAVPSDVKSVVRSVFCLNKFQEEEEEEEDVIKDRIKLGFDAVKSLNELNVALEDRRMKRRRNMELHREWGEDHFRVGQVVQHKLERYRAIIIGYNYNNANISSSDSKATSLTQKNYSLSTTETTESDDDTSLQKRIKYELLLDSGDAHLLDRTHQQKGMMMGGGGGGGGGTANEFPTATQEELELVTDPCLCRIRNNWTSSNFKKFNIHNNSFEPNHILQFEHPITNDDSHNDIDTQQTKQTEKISQQVIQGIQQMAKELNSSVTDSINTLSSSSPVLSNLNEKLTSITNGNILSPEQQLNISTLTPSSSSESSQSNAILHLQAFLNLTLHHSSLLHKRYTSLQHKPSIHYPLGTIIKHSKYNYRGVIIGWDGTPQTNVSNWDGLQNIPDVTKKPFYHVVPDQNDCRKIFGGERMLKYVCQDNVDEYYLGKGERLEVDLDMSDWRTCVEEEWVDDDSDEGLYYEPSEELKFQYAESLGKDEDIIVSCMEKVMSDITALHVSILDNDKSNNANNDKYEEYNNTKDNNNDTLLPEENDISPKLSMANLFHLLQHAENLDDGIVVEETIKELWKVHPNPALRYKLDDGTSLLLNGNTRDALDIFTSLVEEKEEGGDETKKEVVGYDETYFEAWNKKSTCHYMLGENDESIKAAQKTLQYQPRHFQARNGIGLIQYEEGNYESAVEAFREALRLDPWSPVSTRYSSCLDQVEMVKKNKIRDEKEKNDEVKDKTVE